ncbi:MAG: hypothetical protein WCQ99_10525 [Pseudomonadota bacterium]
MRSVISWQILLEPELHILDARLDNLPKILRIFNFQLECSIAL